jgi:hypothetical protein
MAKEPVEDTAFEDAFKQFAAPADTKAEDKSDDVANEAGDDTGAAVDTSADGGAVDDKQAGADDEIAGDKSAGDEGSDGGAGDGVSSTDTGEPKQDDKAAADNAADDILQRLSSLIKEAPAEEKKQEAPGAQQEELPPIYSDEEKEFLKTYEADWSDVAKGEALKRKAEYREMMQYMFSEVAKHLTPVVDMVNELATRTHLGDLQQRVPDYNDLRDKVVDWVETQPVYLQIGMKEVMKSGTADEVADLIERYRKETGQAAPAVTDTKREDKAELSDTAKKAAKELAPVSTKRSAVPQNDDPNDFDAAFAKFAGGAR